MVPYKLFEHLCSLCVTLSDSPSLAMASGLEGVDHSPFLLSLFHPLLLPSVAMAYELRERLELLVLMVLPSLSISMTLGSEDRKPWCLLRIS